MITLHTFVFNPFQENTFVLADSSGECIIIDAGCYSEEEKHHLTEFISSKNYRPVKLVNTHCHVDHLLGNAYLHATYQILLEAAQADEFLLENAVEHGSMFGFHVETPPAISRYLSEGEELIFGKSALKVIELPGHSPGSIGLFSPEQKFLIAGDVLFQGSIGRTDLPGGDFNTLINSIERKILPLGDEVTVWPGHGPSTSIGQERMHNPFLNK
jgi:hydroxyacylglutathione hydrolase